MSTEKSLFLFDIDQGFYIGFTTGSASFKDNINVIVEKEI